MSELMKSNEQNLPVALEQDPEVLRPARMVVRNYFLKWGGVNLDPFFVWESLEGVLKDTIPGIDLPKRGSKECADQLDKIMAVLGFTPDPEDEGWYKAGPQYAEAQSHAQKAFEIMDERMPTFGH